jgi:hypothetical protein
MQYSHGVCQPVLHDRTTALLAAAAYGRSALITALHLLKMLLSGADYQGTACHQCYRAVLHIVLCCSCSLG